MSQIFCIIDGMTDPGFHPQDYPNLAGMKLTRYVDTCRGSAPESLGCILHLLGVQEIPGNLRGYGEALGAGIAVGREDLVLRGSWFGLDGEGRCTVPVAAPEKLNALGLCRYYHLEKYKSLLVFPNMASEIHSIVTYPPYACVGQRAAELWPRGCAPLEALYGRCLEKERCLIPWGQSVSGRLPCFPEPAAVVCGTTIVKGIARLLQMELVEVPGGTGDVDTDLRGKVQAALLAAKSSAFVLLHINGADEAAHRRDAAQKKQFLQQVDRLVLAPLLQSGHKISVIADHGTDPADGSHLGFPQPLFEG